MRFVPFVFKMESLHTWKHVWPVFRNSLVSLPRRRKRGLFRPSIPIEVLSSTCSTSWLASNTHRNFSTKKGKETDKRSEMFALEKQTWAEKYPIPSTWLPYIQLARLNRPAGTFMLLWPGYWSIAMATPMAEMPDAKLLALFGVGSLIMRSAGCTINDMWDRDFDRQVERTNQRPLAAQTLTQKQALAFLALQLSAGLGILLQLNEFSILLGASSMGLVTLYPLMKRITHWPQAFLGLTFNWGALLGWAAVQGSCDWSVVLPLYLGGVSWTIVYDTLYAHQDREDDKRIGVRSTALLFGKNTPWILTGFSAVSIGFFGLSGYNAELSWPFYISLSAAAGHLAWQVGTADINDPRNLQKRFGSNKWLGAILLSGIVGSKFMA